MADAAPGVQNMFSRKYRPQLILSGFSTLFQQWTGINILVRFHFWLPAVTVSLPS